MHTSRCSTSVEQTDGGPPLRVLLLIKGLGVGGAERLLERAIPYLDRKSFDYHIGYLLASKDDLAGPFKAADIPVHCLAFRSVIDIGVLTRLEAVLRRERIDLIHAHLPMAGVLARFAKLFTPVRWVVYTEHNIPRRYRPVSRFLNAGTYHLNDAVIAVAEEIERYARSYIRRGRPFLLTIQNAVDAEALEKNPAHRDEVCEEFHFPNDALIIVNVASLQPKKGHRYLLTAARRVVACEPRARFLLVGSGPLESRLREEVRRSGLYTHVVLTGLRSDATRLAGTADLFVLSSVSEGLPVALLEAMALGRPVVATRVGGVPNVIVSGKTGVLVDPKNPDQLAVAILDLLRNPAHGRYLAEMARQRVRRGGMAQMVATIENLYRRVTRGEVNPRNPGIRG